MALEILKITESGLKYILQLKTGVATQVNAIANCLLLASEELNHSLLLIRFGR